MALLVRETARRNTALAAAIASEPMDGLPKVAGDWLERQAGEHRDWDVLTVEFWLAAARDPEIADRLREGRKEIVDELSRFVDARLAAWGSRPGLSGRDIVILVDALGTGLLMNSLLDPETVRPELFAEALRRLLALGPGPSGQEPADGPPAAAQDARSPGAGPAG
jgi:hypothetical protein